MEALNRASAVARSGDAELAAGGISGQSGAGNKAGRAGRGASQNRLSFRLDTPLHMKATSFRRMYRDAKVIQPPGRIPVWQEPSAKRGRLRANPNSKFVSCFADRRSLEFCTDDASQGRLWGGFRPFRSDEPTAGGTDTGRSRDRDDSLRSTRGDYGFGEGRAEESILDCAIDQLFDQPAVVRIQRAGRLAHIDANELLLRVDPEIGSGIPTPGELPGRSHYRGNAHA
jgi:hypothetical protein